MKTRHIGGFSRILQRDSYLSLTRLAHKRNNRYSVAPLLTHPPLPPVKTRHIGGFSYILQRDSYLSLTRLAHKHTTPARVPH